MSEIVKNRYDFIYLFDVKDGNPNGDPDQGNSPRIDFEDNHGLVTDVCIKRKVRNYIQIAKKCEEPYNIFIRSSDFMPADKRDEIYALNPVIDKAQKDTDSKKDARDLLCSNYYDIRTFGAVLSTGSKKAAEEKGSEKKDKNKKEGNRKGVGTVRGPVQFTFARSVDTIYATEHSITRCVITKEEEASKESTFGKKSTVPYGLYKMHGFISASDAAISNFTEDDLSLLWEALLNAFEHDRAAARGLMNARKLIVFKHESSLGNARSGELFDRVDIKLNIESGLPRDYSDYTININCDNLQSGIEIIEMA